jgi:hypothetical protein
MKTLQDIRDEAAGRELKGSMTTQLHAAYDDVLTQELPPHFHELLRLLDQSRAALRTAAAG